MAFLVIIYRAGKKFDLNNNSKKAILEGTVLLKTELEAWSSFVLIYSFEKNVIEYIRRVLSLILNEIQTDNISLL
jgi:hypothetical protein